MPGEYSGRYTRLATHLPLLPMLKNKRKYLSTRQDIDMSWTVKTFIIRFHSLQLSQGLLNTPYIMELARRGGKFKAPGLFN